MAHTAIAKPAMPAGRQFLLNAYWFSTNAMWTSILVIILPRQIESLVGDSSRGMLLGLVLGVGAVVSTISGPLFGALSDRISLPGGRRKPWIVIGTLGVIPCLWALAYWTRPGEIGSLPDWIIAFIALEIFSNVAAAPAAALIPDQVPPTQRGSAAGWLGSMSMLGIFAGAATGLLIGPFGITAIYNLLIVIMILGALAAFFGVQEIDTRPATSGFAWRKFVTGLYAPFTHSDFAWVFFTRFLISMGMFTIQEFIFYYMADAFGRSYTLPFLGTAATTAEDAVSIFLLVLFLGAIATSLIAGILSDKYGRKPLAYAASLTLGIMATVFTFSHSFALSILVGVVFGFAYGAYESLSWALAADALPSHSDHGKDMGLWHIAVVLPQIVATPLAGFLLDQFYSISTATSLPRMMGYVIIFIIAVVYFISGSIFLKEIKGLR